MPSQNAILATLIVVYSQGINLQMDRYEVWQGNRFQIATALYSINRDQKKNRKVSVICCLGNWPESWTLLIK